MWEWSLEFSLLLWLYAEGLTIFTLFGLVFILFGGLLITVFRVVLNFAGLMNHLLAVGFLWFWCSFLVFVTLPVFIFINIFYYLDWVYWRLFKIKRIQLPDQQWCTGYPAEISAFIRNGIRLYAHPSKGL